MTQLLPNIAICFGEILYQSVSGKTSVVRQILFTEFSDKRVVRLHEVDYKSLLWILFCHLDRLRHYDSGGYCLLFFVPTGLPNVCHTKDIASVLTYPWVCCYPDNIVKLFVSNVVL